MAIEPAYVPATAVEAVTQGLIRRAAAGSFVSPNLARANRNALSLAMPHRVAYLPFNAVRPDLDLREAVQFGSWRFLVHEKKGENTFLPIAAVTAVPDKTGHQLGELDEGSLVAGTEQAIRRGEELSQVREGRFEACLLIVPSLYVLALWLRDHCRRDKTDVFLAIPPSHSDLPSVEPMSEVAFIGILNKLATKAMAGGAAG